MMEIVSSTSSRNYLEEMITTVTKSSVHIFDKSNNRAKQSFNKSFFFFLRGGGGVEGEFQQVQRAFSEISKYKT